MAMMHRNGHQEPIHFKDLAGIDDQISQSVSGSQKFADDHAHQAEADVDLHIAENGRYAAGKHNLCKRMEAAAAQGVDQLDLSRVTVVKLV